MIFLFEELNVCYFTFALLFAVGKSDMLIFRFLEKPFHLLKKNISKPFSEPCMETLIAMVRHKHELQLPKGGDDLSTGNSNHRKI